MIRWVSGLIYELTYKNVKNINLRIKSDGSICVSANKHINVLKIDEFILEKYSWIIEKRRQSFNKQPLTYNFTNEECLDIFNKISDEIYEIFKNKIIKRPLIKVKAMKSVWGVCHYQKYYISLNKALLNKPKEAIEYVIMHEYIHFIEHNHGERFYKIMKELMPDYKIRKNLLK